MWDEISGPEFCAQINDAFNEVVHWRHNIFQVPSGKQGTAFVTELARLYQTYADASTLECIASTVFQCLMLQKPHAKSKSKDHYISLDRRLSLWKSGNITALLREDRCIQGHIPSPVSTKQDMEKKARVFSRLMFEGKVNAALHYISRDVTGGILSLDDLIPINEANNPPSYQSTRSILMGKHPVGRSAHPDILLPPESDSTYDSVLFEQVTGEAIKQAAFHTRGAVGPSGVDVYLWRRLCSSFKRTSNDLYNAL